MIGAPTAIRRARVKFGQRFQFQTTEFRILPITRFGIGNQGCSRGAQCGSSNEEGSEPRLTIGRPVPPDTVAQ
jgi:hypothetical protein